MLVINSCYFVYPKFLTDSVPELELNVSPPSAAAAARRPVSVAIPYTCFSPADIVHFSGITGVSYTSTASTAHRRAVALYDDLKLVHTMPPSALLDVLGVGPNTYCYLISYFAVFGSQILVPEWSLAKYRSSASKVREILQCV